MKRICNPYSVCKQSFLRKILTNTKVLSVFAICLICIVSIFANNAGNYVNSFNAKNVLDAYVIKPDAVDSVAVYQDSIQILRLKLTDAIDNYMKSVYPLTKMSPSYIADICLEKNFDIPLLLSQAHLESHFGKRTGGTNSCFGVVKRRYTHVDESVADYVKIMQKSYVRTRSADACIRSGFRVEGSKTAKYAEDPLYSQTISSIRSKIIKKTDIPMLVEQINYLESLKNNLIELNNGSPEENRPNIDSIS